MIFPSLIFKLKREFLFKIKLSKYLNNYNCLRYLFRGVLLLPGSSYHSIVYPPFGPVSLCLGQLVLLGTFFTQVEIEQAHYSVTSRLFLVEKLPRHSLPSVSVICTRHSTLLWFRMFSYNVVRSRFQLPQLLQSQSLLIYFKHENPLP